MRLVKTILVAACALTLLAPPASADEETISPEGREFLEWHYATYEELFPGSGTYVLRSEAPAIRNFLADLHRASWMPVLDCIAYYESEGRGTMPVGSGYGAQNPRSSASGRYQFIQRTANNVARWIGHPELVGVRARYWPAHLQDDGAIALIEYQGGHVEPAWQGRGHCDGRR